VAAKENSIEVNDPSPAMNFKIKRVLWRSSLSVSAVLLGNTRLLTWFQIERVMSSTSETIVINEKSENLRVPSNDLSTCAQYVPI
jgi:hypothetical protein